jgi:hypothetical protein
VTEPDGIPFDLARHADAPLWLLVLVACRATRRAAAAPSVPASSRSTIWRGCDAVDACIAEGRWLRESAPVINRGAAMQPGLDAYQAALAFGQLASATRAADAALDFSAAETSCVASIWRSLREAWRGAGGAGASRSDIETLRPACRAARVGRYDGIPSAISALVPPIARPTDPAPAVPP